MADSSVLLALHEAGTLTAEQVVTIMKAAKRKLDDAPPEPATKKARGPPGLLFYHSLDSLVF